MRDMIKKTVWSSVGRSNVESILRINIGVAAAIIVPEMRRPSLRANSRVLS